MTRILTWLTKKSAPAAPVEPPECVAIADGRDLRRPVHVCAGCRSWHTKLVYLENGLDYCVSCAVKLGKLYGLAPAGKRDDDVKSLDGARDSGPHEVDGDMLPASPEGCTTIGSAGAANDPFRRSISQQPMGHPDGVGPGTLDEHLQVITSANDHRRGLTLAEKNRLLRMSGY